MLVERELSLLGPKWYIKNPNTSCNNNDDDDKNKQNNNLKSKKKIMFNKKKGGHGVGRLFLLLAVVRHYRWTRSPATTSVCNSQFLVTILCLPWTT